MITLADVSLPAPSSLSVSVSLQGGSTQFNTLGERVQDGVREKRTVDISWRCLSAETLASLSQALNGDFLSCSYPDPLLGPRTMTCRCSRQSARVYRCPDSTPQWADVNLTLEER